MEDTSPELFVPCQLAVYPGPDFVEDLLLLTTQQLRGCRREADIGQRNLCCLRIVVDCADCSVDHVWMTQKYVFEF